MGTDALMRQIAATVPAETALAAIERLGRGSGSLPLEVQVACVWHPDPRVVTAAIERGHGGLDFAALERRVLEDLREEGLPWTPLLDRWVAANERWSTLGRTERESTRGALVRLAGEIERAPDPTLSARIAAHQEARQGGSTTILGLLARHDPWLDREGALDAFWRGQAQGLAANDRTGDPVIEEDLDAAAIREVGQLGLGAKGALHWWRGQLDRAATLSTAVRVTLLETLQRAERERLADSGWLELWLHPGLDLWEEGRRMLLTPLVLKAVIGAGRLPDLLRGPRWSAAERGGAVERALDLARQRPDSSVFSALLDAGWEGDAAVRTALARHICRSRRSTEVSHFLGRLGDEGRLVLLDLLAGDENEHWQDPRGPWPDLALAPLSSEAWARLPRATVARLSVTGTPEAREMLARWLGQGRDGVAPVGLTSTPSTARRR